MSLHRLVTSFLLSLATFRQLFQGKVSSAADSCSTAVDMLQTDEDHTPDTEALGKVRTVTFNSQSPRFFTDEQLLSVANHRGSSPSVPCLFQALRQLGSIQMLDGAEDEAETSLLRAVRLGSTAASQVKVIIPRPKCMSCCFVCSGVITPP